MRPPRAGSAPGRVPVLRLPAGLDPQATRELGLPARLASSQGGVALLSSPPTTATLRSLGLPAGTRAVAGRGVYALELEPGEPPSRPRPVKWQLRCGTELTLAAGRPRVMGILNATPDSFFDGKPGTPSQALVARGLAQVSAGAELLDVGGESTRPGAAEVAVEEELARVVPVLRGLRARAPGLPLSIDTRKAAVAQGALAAGADLVNDVSGLAHDPAMAEVVAAAGVPLVLMHMRGTPATMRGLTGYPTWVPAAVAFELAEALARARRAGIPRRSIALDPGIGFAKDWRQGLELIRRLDVIVALGCPVLVGASRKSLLASAAGSGPDPGSRLAGSLVLAVEAARRGAALLRVHDVGETVQALRTWAAVEAGLAAPDLSGD